jgi:hypothetical protein
MRRCLVANPHNQHGPQVLVFHQNLVPKTTYEEESLERVLMTFALKVKGKDRGKHVEWKVEAFGQGG